MMRSQWRVLVIGGGLIGTSIALKVAQIGGLVRLVDPNEARQRVANGLAGGALLTENDQVNLVVAATPVDVLPVVISDALIRHPHATVIDTGSIKTKVIHEVWSYLTKSSNENLMRNFVPSHPMAGRELSGPDGARSDLFEGRAWALTPHPEASPMAVSEATAFIGALGATCHQLGPQEHDRQVAMTSHLPQLLSSALAGVLHAPLDLAGQGLRDMTRLAISDAAMWQPILEGNEAEISPLLDAVVKSINELKDKHFNKQSVLSFMERGAEGAERVPGKHGGSQRIYGSISVVIPDRAGELARLFNHCADAEINIEDLRIEHSPGQETGLISLFVKPDDLSTLNDYLSTLGWHSTVLSKGV